MGKALDTIAVAGRTPFAFVLAGLLAADHKRKVFLIGGAPSVRDVPPPSSFSVAPVTRPETLKLALDTAPDMFRRIGRIAPESLERTDLIARPATPFHAAALSHFRHLATSMGLTVERDVNGPDGTIKLRDVTRFSPLPFIAKAKDWATQIGVELVEDGSTLTVRRTGASTLNGMTMDQLVLADDNAIVTWLETGVVEKLGHLSPHLAYLAEQGHGLDAPLLALPSGTLLCPERDGSLAIHADNSDGAAEARIAALLPGGTEARKAARRAYQQLNIHDGAPIIGQVKRSKAFVVAGLGLLDLALAPVIARHIVGETGGLEADWCKRHAPERDMVQSAVADIGARSSL